MFVSLLIEPSRPRVEFSVGSASGLQRLAGARLEVDGSCQWLRVRTDPELDMPRRLDSGFDDPILITDLHMMVVCPGGVWG